MSGILVYADGSCIGSGRRCPGGYAALILDGRTEHVVTGREPETTSTAMELMGVIRALETLPAGRAVTVVTDSRAVITGATERLPWWRSRRWRIVKGGKVADRVLWQRLSALMEGRVITWRWVRGHAGDELNERVHALAQAEARAACLTARSAARSGGAGAGGCG
ncbi:MAG: ribonuclease H [Microvirga sp.]